MERVDALILPHLARRDRKDRHAWFNRDSDRRAAPTDQTRAPGFNSFGKVDLRQLTSPISLYRDRSFMLNLLSEIIRRSSSTTFSTA